ncbi:MAG: thiamine biosynthesis protein ThiF [Candidatus Reconcilbacillus cellulovorans]|uniref:Thiamine biosynthesis protein ThiF n=1 Tax=Candidatus Reconcilbacillus cellulovorans TaxID=1906605 RepID=A0A2A6DYA7_9BACL|nr:MAG: thiamine biosynthesis protein ThiF [Candidatus Reconcilbacillus cellulovorans]
MNAMFSRYSRQTLFAPIGEEGQTKLARARVAVVGVGALGTVAAELLVRAGVGYVRLIDRDVVEPSNLQRQSLYDETDAAESVPKAVAAARKLQAINTAVEIDAHVADLHPYNAETLLSDVDLIVDGTDNFPVRFLINDVAVKHRIAWIYGGAVRSHGVVMPIVPGETPCLRCLFDRPPEDGTAETCDTVGVIGPITHLIASLEAAEALKWLVGDRKNLSRSMTTVDVWHNRFAAVDVSRSRKPDCPACGAGRFEFLDAAAAEDTVETLCGRDAVQIVPVRPRSPDLSLLENRLSRLGTVERTPYLLKFRPDPSRTIMLFPDGRAIVQGTDDPTAAKTLYARYVGV